MSLVLIQATETQPRTLGFAIHNQARSALVRMGGNPIVAMRFDAMIGLAGLVGRIDVDNHAGKELQVMPKLVLDLFGKLMSALYCQLGCHSDAELSV